MKPMFDFLKNLLLQTPIEIVISILRIIFIVVLLPIILLLFICELLVKLYKNRKNTKLFCEKDSKQRCKSNIPESLMRRPDPCIYSQKYLQSQGLSVTWNNPDILLIRADRPIEIANTEPDSYHLQEDTDYYVRVRINNSAPVLALGVRVRLVYRPWSFNSPDLTPVQIDAHGNEVIHYVDVPPMAGSTNPNDPNDGTFATFKWHTPKIDQDQKHFCLQAELFHPVDTNNLNNMGQENTNVYSAKPGDVKPGQVLDFTVPLFNNRETSQQFFFEANTYEIDDEEITLKLKTAYGLPKVAPSQRLANFVPTWHLKDSLLGGHFNMKRKDRQPLAKYRYWGLESYKEKLLSREFPLPEGMTIVANGNPLNEGVSLRPKESIGINVQVRIPQDVAPDSTIALNIMAKSRPNILTGGITLLLTIKGEE